MATTEAILSPKWHWSLFPLILLSLPLLLHLSTFLHHLLNLQVMGIAFCFKGLREIQADFHVKEALY